MLSTSGSILAVQPREQAIVAAVLCPELNHENTQQLQRELTAALATAPEAALVLDLSQVAFMPSLAMGMLVSVHKQLAQRGCRCLLVGIQPLVLDALKVSALNRFFALHATIEEGLEQLAIPTGVA